MKTAVLALAVAALTVPACTLNHSKQALRTDFEMLPSPSATFVSEEDSGLSLFGLLTLSEPDHYAVLLARAERRYACARIHSAQLDFFTDHWVIVAFPIARLTAICEPLSQPASGGSTAPPTATSTRS